MRKLRTLRRAYALFFMGLFLFLVFVADYRNMQGYAIAWFLEADPLTAIATLLTSGTLYSGLAWAVAIVSLTLIFGRAFCSWICPLGILNQFLSVFLRKRRTKEVVDENPYRPIYRVKYYILAGLLVLSAFGALQTGLLDPIALTVRSFTAAVWPAAQYAGGGFYLKQPLFNGGVLIAVMFLAILLANRFMTRFFCRVLCPLGALLGVIAAGAPFRIRRDVEKCTDCAKCLHHCQGGCDPNTELRVSECHACMNCLEQCPEGALHYGLAKETSSIHKPLDVNRRRLLETAAGTALFYPMMKASIASGSVPGPEVIRPPGSLREEDFLARCIKCAACMRVCPTNVLQPALLEAGLEGLWTPILDNGIGWCEHQCVLCGQACPTGAILRISVAEKVGSPPFGKPIKLGTAFFDRGRCLPWAMDVPCIVCEEVCPTSPKAIWVDPVTVTQRDGKKIDLRQPHLEPELCIGCGICENQCPVKGEAAVRVSSVGESRSKKNRMLLPGLGKGMK